MKFFLELQVVFEEFGIDNEDLIAKAKFRAEKIKGEFNKCTGLFAQVKNITSNEINFDKNE